MNNLRQIRKSKGITMKQLGQMVGTAESTISLYERGIHDPDITTLNRLADVLDVSVDELIGRNESQKDAADDAWELRERLRRDPDMRILFSAASRASPEHLRAAAAMLKALEPEEQDVD